MRIYTRQGDKGMTRLADGIQLPKDHLRVETYGYIDELNSHIGLLICDVPSQEVGLLADLQPYWFPHMSSVTKRFVSRCHPCFLSYRSSRKQTAGYYPVPKRAFEELMLDLCENLNSAGGYSHLLIMQDILSDFTIIVPLKSKTSSEITKVMLNGVLQNFNVEKIHTDNGPGFRSTSWLEAMSAFGVKVISSSALPRLDGM